MDLPPMKIIGMLALFVVLILFGALYLSSSGTSSQKSTSSTTAIFKTSSTTTVDLTGGSTTVPGQKVNNIVVSGMISVTGSGITITNVSFYETNPNVTYSTRV